MKGWLSALVSEPVKEYRQFEAALPLLPALPPKEAQALLAQRRGRLEAHGAPSSGQASARGALMGRALYPVVRGPHSAMHYTPRRLSIRRTRACVH